MHPYGFKKIHPHKAIHPRTHDRARRNAHAKFGDPMRVFLGSRAGLMAILLGIAGVATLVRAEPGATWQTGRSCATCHAGLFSPRSDPDARVERFAAYAVPDVKPWSPPGPMIVPVSFTPPPPSAGGEARWYPPDRDAALDRAAVYFASRPTGDAGALVAPRDDGISPSRQPGGNEVRRTDEFNLFGPSDGGGMETGGRTAGNNSVASRVFALPRSDMKAPVASQTAATPARSVTSPRTRPPGAAPLAADLFAYRDAGRDPSSAAGPTMVAGTAWTGSSTPYWRIAVQKDLERHFLQIGTYRRSVRLASGGNPSAGITDSLNDTAAGASYRFTIDPNGLVSDVLSAHASLSHEGRPLGANSTALGTNGFNARDTFRAGASYSFSETVTPSIQYFRSSGPADPFPGVWPGNRPNSAGVIARVEYAPWSGPDSPIQFLNLRFAAQYVAYTEVNASARGTGGNKAVYLSLWGALHF
jgi:hypothetical protein